MPKRVIIELTEIERETLAAFIKKGRDWREHERAMTIQWLSEGIPVSEIALRQGRHPETIRERRRQWQKHGFCSLQDRPRSGAPSKLNEDDRRLLKEWVENEPLTSRALLMRLNEQSSTVVSERTLRNKLKQMGFIWKRTRYSLKKSAMKNALNRPEKTSNS